MRDISRRNLLRLALAAAASGSVPGCLAAQPYLDPAAIGTTPLSKRADARGLLFGTEVGHKQFQDPRYTRVLKDDFGILVTGNELKWGSLEWREGVVDFSRPDRILAFAEANGMTFRGHTLLWHMQTPPWLEAALADGDRKPHDILSAHIRTVAGRYAGHMHSWDVVNEVIEPNDGRADGLRESMFLAAMGPDYIADAFHQAAQADPHAMLVFNEYGLEWGWNVGRQRRRHTLAILEKLLGAGVPVHALGIQGHLAPGMEGSFDARALAAFLQKVAGMGLKILATEVDARDSEITGSLETRDRLVADAYWRFLDVMLERKETEAVLLWGFCDRYSWLTRHFPRKDGEVVRGTLYDTDFNKKPAWYAVAAALDRKPGGTG